MNTVSKGAQMKKDCVLCSIQIRIEFFFVSIPNNRSYSVLAALSKTLYLFCAFVS